MGSSCVRGGKIQKDLLNPAKKKLCVTIVPNERTYVQFTGSCLCRSLLPRGLIVSGNGTPAARESRLWLELA